MGKIKMQLLIKNIILTLILLKGSYCFAEQSKQERQELLMKGLYEYEKNADYTNDPEGKRKSDEYIKQYEEVQQHKHNVEKQQEKIEIYNEAFKILKEKEKSQIKKDQSHELENKIIKQYKVSRLEAHKMIQNYDPRAEKIWQAMIQAETAKNLKEARKRIKERKRRHNSEK